MKITSILLAVLFAVAACSPTFAQAPPDAKGSPAADRLVERMRGISMQAAAGGRSDGKPDPREERRKDIENKLRMLGEEAVPALVRTLGDEDVQMRRNSTLVLISLAGAYDAKPKVNIKKASPA